MQPAVQRREDEQVEQIGRSHPKGALARARFESFFEERGPLEVEQRVSNGTLQGFGPWGERHLGSGAHEQRVAESDAQPAQGVAHRRLAEAQGLGGRGDPARIGEGVEGEQQVEVELAKPPEGIMHRAHGGMVEHHAPRRWLRCRLRPWMQLSSWFSAPPAPPVGPSSSKVSPLATG